MRKLCVALSIALLFALLPAGSMAETIDVEVTQISDPVMYLDDEPYIDLSGLTLQLTEGATADGSRSAHFEHTILVEEAGTLVARIQAIFGG